MGEGDKYWLESEAEKDELVKALENALHGWYCAAGMKVPPEEDYRESREVLERFTLRLRQRRAAR